MRGKKFSLLLKREVSGRFWLENATFTNKLNFFFSHIQILIFHHETTQDDHIRSLYEFGIDKKNWVGLSCGYAPASVKGFKNSEKNSFLGNYLWKYSNC